MRRLWNIIGILALILACGQAQAQGANAQPPLSIRNIAAALQAMGRADAATQLISDFRSGRVVLGSPGSNAMTAPPLIVPIVTGRASNIMTLDKGLGPVCDTRATERNPVTNGTLTWALTVIHEYVHMNQDNPQQSPRYENPAWRATLEENQRWMRHVMSQVTDAELHMPNGPDKVARLNQLINTLNDLRNVHNTTINDLWQEIGAGNVGSALDWPTIDLGTTKDLGQVTSSCNTLVDTFIRNTREGFARFQKGTSNQGVTLNTSPAKPASLFDGVWLRTRRQHTDCSFSADSDITITTDAQGMTRIDSGDFLGVTRGTVFGRTLTFEYGIANGVPAGTGTFTLSQDGRSFTGTFADKVGHRGTVTGHR